MPTTCPFHEPVASTESRCGIWRIFVGVSALLVQPPICAAENQHGAEVSRCAGEEDEVDEQPGHPAGKTVESQRASRDHGITPRGVRGRTEVVVAETSRGSAAAWAT
jgi:hypothetical protein